MAEDPALPISRAVNEQILWHGSQHEDWATLCWDEGADFLFDSIESFYGELFDFATGRYGARIEPSLANSLVRAQAAVMPRSGRQYPWSVELAHDLAGYLEQIRSAPSLQALPGNFRPLTAFDTGSLSVDSEESFQSSIVFATSQGHAE